MRRALLASALLFLSACGSTQPADEPPRFLKVPIGNAPLLVPSGAGADAWVTIVVFSDLQCPYCSREHAVLAQLVGRYQPGDVRLVWKHFPLSSIHLRARPAAIAAECARTAGGSFWNMVGLVFGNQSSLGDAALQGYAVTAGADAAAYAACLAAPDAAAAVDADLALAQTLGIRATPTMAVNGQTIVGAQPLPVMQAAVDAALDTAVASGIPLAEYYDRAVLGR